MKQTLPLLITALLLGAGNVHAAWTRAGENDDMVVYADNTTVQRTGTLARLWQLNNLKAERSTAVTMSAGEWYSSVRLHLEYDCAAEKARILAFVAHTAPMGGGKVVLDDKEVQAWSAITRDPIYVALYKMACNNP